MISWRGGAASWRWPAPRRPIGRPIDTIRSNFSQHRAARLCRDREVCLLVLTATGAATALQDQTGRRSPCSSSDWRSGSASSCCCCRPTSASRRASTAPPSPTVERATTFCDRNAQGLRRRRRAVGDVREEGRVRRAHGHRPRELGGRKKDEAAPTRALAARQLPSGQGRAQAAAGAARGTLTPADLAPAWRGQVQRTGAT